MSEQTDMLISLLIPYGLSVDEARVYLDILERGTLTALQISRNIHMGRTKVYRILDNLIESGLITQKYDDVGMKFIANEPTQLKLLLSKQEGKLNSLKESVDEVVGTLRQYTSGTETGSKTLYYRGKTGLSKVNFNLLNADREFFSYEVSYAEAYMDHNEAEQLRQELVNQKIKAISLTNLKQFPEFTNITKFVTDYLEMRYIDPKIFEIKADIFIYNDVYAICNYLSNHDVFCIEIYNRLMAEMQKQLFNTLWHQAQPLTILSDYGEAKLIV